MAHPNEDLLRRAYAAFGGGDLAGYLACCAGDITFRVPGRGIVAGLFSREQFFDPFISTVMKGTGGTFRETVLDVVANDSAGAVMARHEFERKGRAYSYDTIHLYRIEHGKLKRFQEYPEDLYAFDAAWAP